MKVKKKFKINKKIISANVLVSIVFVSILSFVSVGFALYSQELNISGVASFGDKGKFAITDVQLVSAENVQEGSVPAFTDDAINFNLTFAKNGNAKKSKFTATYNIVLSNNSFYDYDFNFMPFSPKIINSSNVEIDPSTLTYEINGINIGETIMQGESKTVTFTINFSPEVNDTYKIVGNLETMLVEKPHGSILATISNNETINLRKSEGNTIAKTTISIINSYKSDKEVSLSIDNPNFLLVNFDGSLLENIVVSGEGMAEIPVYIKLVDDVKFSSEEISTGISLNYIGGTINCGSIKINVDIDESYMDTTPPIISNVNAEIEKAITDDVSVNNAGAIKVTWSVDDESINHYTLLVYSVSNSEETLIEKYTTVERSFIVTNLVDGDYVFKVYGTDSSVNKNTASSIDIQNATTNPGYCSKSSSATYKWHHLVTTNLSNVVSSESTKKVNRGYDYTTTVSANTSYSLPSSITVKMNNETLSSGTNIGQYQYSSTSGIITVYGVTGDLDISVSATKNGGCGF